MIKKRKTGGREEGKKVNKKDETRMITRIK